jgi:hypothetical protein
VASLEHRLFQQRLDMLRRHSIGCEAGAERPHALPDDGPAWVPSPSC